MIKWFFKYGAVFFLLNTILLSVKQTVVIGEFVFLGVMGVFSFLVLINPPQIKNIIFHKSFRFFLILNGLNIFYFILFHNINDFEAAKYLIARGFQFSLISFSIYHNYEYFKARFFKHLIYSIFGVVVLGLIVNPFIFSGRYSGIIWNPNMLSSFTCIAFSALFLGVKKKTKFELLLLWLFLIISLATGSRGVLVGVSLAFIFKYGLSIRNMLYALLAFSIYFLLLNVNLDTSVNRFASQGILNDRLLQLQYAYETILQKPFFGSGLDKYAYINHELIPYYLSGHIISAHNSFLAIFVQYGFIFGFFIIGIIFYQTIRFYLKIDKDDPVELFYFYIIIYAILASVYENLITGINEFHTILFWFSFGFLSYSIYRRENGN
ncbi:MAG: O-antigen ligase family protein [Flavobacteriales bacterium]|nr:O-antigen ligase family protein [Flavobacteriales bacterium]